MKKTLSLILLLAFVSVASITHKNTKNTSFSRKAPLGGSIKIKIKNDSAVVVSGDTDNGETDVVRRGGAVVSVLTDNKKTTYPANASKTQTHRCPFDKIEPMNIYSPRQCLPNSTFLATGCCEYS